MNAKKRATDLFFELIGSFLYAGGIQCFVNPANIAPGGMAGIGILLNHLTGFPIGTAVFLLNVPILYFGFRHLNLRMIRRTLFTIILGSILLDYVVTPFFPVYTGNRLLGAVFGGVLMGAGLGIIFWRGSTTGGTDVLSFLVQKRFPHIPIGRAMLMIDCVIIALSMAVFRNIETGMYGIISLYCCTQVIDALVYGTESGNLVLIISSRPDDIAQGILNRLKRGVTLLPSQGAYSGQQRDLLFCVVRRPEFSSLKRLTLSIDPNAFIVVGRADDIIGEGFKEY